MAQAEFAVRAPERAVGLLEPCKLCETRGKAIKAGTWDVRFRWCPWCGTAWRAGDSRD